MGGRYEVRVLEPSPPAIVDPPWLADDPIETGDYPGSLPLLTPIDDGNLSWDELARGDQSLASWCAERWLGAWKTLPALPATFSQTRIALHTFAEHVIAPARHASNGKIGLRFTRRGFGTPFFGADQQARIEGVELVLQSEDSERRAPLTTIEEAARQIGIAPGAPTDVYAPTTAMEPDKRFEIDPEAAVLVGDWFGFATSVLEQLRSECPVDDNPSRVQIWPEHFDIALDAGDEVAGNRAGFGASLGDDAHPEPYLYVTPWVHQEDAWWSDGDFGGARLDYQDLLDASDQRATALDFYRASYTKLRSP
jgi:hypothetical protein